ncbi:hypothetical protein KUL113_05150 [Tenacibaculum sp. KUL113]|nr:hypothetical protein KUL113_05150 [Tenacibaculum sp. KUL113]
MKTLSKYMLLSIALSSIASSPSFALENEASFSMTQAKEISSNKNIKKQRLNKSLALNALKRSSFPVSRSKKQPSGLFLIHSVLPNNISKAN